MSTPLHRMSTDWLISESALMTEWEARALAEGDAQAATQSAAEREHINAVLRRRGVEPGHIYHQLAATLVAGELVITRRTVASAEPIRQTRYVSATGGEIFAIVWALPGGSFQDRNLATDYLETRWGGTLRDVLLTEAAGIDSGGRVGDALERIDQDLVRSWDAIVSRHLPEYFGAYGPVDDF